MSKPLLILSAPVDTRSGYGEHSRDIFASLLKMDKFDIKIASQPWGNCSRHILDPSIPIHQEMIKRMLPDATQLPRQPEVWIQVTVPNEFQPIGKFNIGITAGIETTICAPEWLEGMNRMQLVIVPSKFSKDVFDSTHYDIMNDQTKTKTGELKTNVPIEVIFEGADLNIYNETTQIPPSIRFELNGIKEDFCYLFVGHWLKGNAGHDRKDVGMLIKVFLETFKREVHPPALILKTSGATFSVMDREETLMKIRQIRESVTPFVVTEPNSSIPNGKTLALPNIYLLHGDLTAEEMNGLYNHGKVKAHVSFTKGEGFCVRKDTRILTSTGLKPISDIKIGESVLTHDGSMQLVTDTLTREYGGKMYKFNPYNSYKNSDNYFTPNHNIYIYNKNDNKFEWKRADEIDISNDMMCYPLNSAYDTIDSIDIYDLIKHNKNLVMMDSGEILYSHSDRTSLPIKSKLTLSANLGKLLGYYVAGGSITDGEIVFSIHENEKDTIGTEIIESMNEIFGISHYNIQQSSSSKAIRIVFHSKIVSYLIFELCGKLSSEKKFHPIILNSNIEFKKNFISSIFVGDGYVSISGDAIEIQLVNPHIVQDLMWMLLNMGITSSYTISDMNTLNIHGSSPIKHKHDVHSLRIGNSESKNLLKEIINSTHDFCNHPFGVNVRTNYVGGRNAYIVGKYVVFPIKDVIVNDFNETVYNLTVENNESYCVENVIVHNCRPLLEASLSGKPVLASNWSGQVDFLHKDYNMLIGGKLQNVDPSAAWEKVILTESQWFYIDYNQAANAMYNAYKDYKGAKAMCARQKDYAKQNFSLEHMHEIFKQVFDKYVPEFAPEVKLKLPALRRINLSKQIKVL